MSRLVKWALGLSLAAQIHASEEFISIVDCWTKIVEGAHNSGTKLGDSHLDNMKACCLASQWDGEGVDDITYSAQDDLYVQFQAQEMAAQNLCETKMTNTFNYLRSVGRKSPMQLPAAIAGAQAASSGVSIAVATLRRFRNLKAMVMVLQPLNITIFGRYCYYGCWCLPNGQHNLAAGFGQPLDPIDEVCKEFALCYKCIDIDFAGTCDVETRGYQWARNKVGTVTVDVTCKNDPTINQNHRCARYLCECDRILAVGLGMFHWHWNISYHARWGAFDRLANCIPGGGDYRQDACCGGYGTATPYWGQPFVGMRRPYASSNPATACCQDVYYYDFLNCECCLNSLNQVVIVDKGTCDNTVLPPDDDQYTTTTTTTFAPITTTTTVAPIAACTGDKLDIILLVDGSGSVTQSNFDLNNAFLKQFAEDMGVHADTIHVAYVQYSSAGTAVVEFSFNSDLQTVKDKIDLITFQNGGTATGAALTFVNNNIVGGGRSGVDKVVMVFTDGFSGDDVVAPSAVLRLSATVFAIGVGANVSQQQLEDMASDPDADHVFNTTFANMSTITQSIGANVCGNSNRPQAKEQQFLEFVSGCADSTDKICTKE